MMHGYFILITGVMVFLLHIPGLIVPEPHRRLGERFVQSKSNLRGIGMLMVIIAAIAAVVSPDGGTTRWLLTVSPETYVQRSATLFSGPIKVWKIRAVAKCAFATVLVVWGVCQLT